MRAFVVLLLVSTFSLASSQSSTNASSSVAPTSVSSDAATLVSSVASSSVSSVAPSSVSSVAPSSVSSVASTTVPSGAPSSTQAPSTPSAMPTTPGLPDVTVNYIQFSRTSCADGVCTYQFDTPGNDQAFLRSEEDAITEDQKNFTSLQTQANDFENNNNLVQPSNDAAQRIADLQKQLDAIQKQMAELSVTMDKIDDQQQQAGNQLIVLGMFINQISPSSCLYMSCLIPTTPKPPTTTPAPPPTTPPSPCLNFPCPNDDCALDKSNNPYCAVCPGNMDGYQHCELASCSPSGTFSSVGGKNEIFLSPGNGTIKANSNCVWTFPQKFYQATNLDLSAFDDSLIVNIQFVSAGAVQNRKLTKGGITLRTLNTIFSTGTNIIVTLTSPNTDVSSWFSWTLTELSSPPEKINNSFVFWLFKAL